jgi:hypothetical protein
MHRSISGSVLIGSYGGSSPGSSRPTSRVGSPKWIEPVSTGPIHCFFIYDNMLEDEFAEQDELLLYFYPPEVDLMKQLFLLGGCSAMISFAKNFASGLT